MTKIIFITALCWMGTAMIFLAASFRSFDLFLKQLYSNSKNTWESLGKPVGFFWVPPECGVRQVGPSSFSRGEFYRNLVSTRISSEIAALDFSRIAKLRAFNRSAKLCFAVALAMLCAAVGSVFF